MRNSRALLNSAIVLYFVMCLEILIMISPFAGFFYSAFNPVLLGLAKYNTTRWLSAFFFNHLLVPTTDLLQFVRIMGSVLFVFGLALFLVCALQVYVHKFLRRGPALRGLYSRIRHPQYLCLALAGAGLAILWPRFLVVVLWILMVLVYYLLAKDEERRMVKQYPEAYGEYMKNAGMFMPRSVERAVRSSTAIGKAAALVVLATVAIGGAFLLRKYTVHHLPLWTESNVVAIAAVPADHIMLEHRMSSILELPEVKTRLDRGAAYLVYLLPPDYIMQGLIGDTGGDWRLYKQHHSISMVADFVIHPFGHLQGGHHTGSTTGGTTHSAHTMNAGMGTGMVRRLIFVKLSAGLGNDPYNAFAIGTTRTPAFMVDMDVHQLQIIGLKSLPTETAWGKVPTPSF